MADSRDLFRSTLSSYGFDNQAAESLFNQILQWQDTYSVDQIVNDLLPNTNEYKERFKANEARVKAGLAPLGAEEYIKTEASYRQALKEAGLPKGFYDSNDDVSAFIANDASPYEIKLRADAAARAVNNADPAYKQALRELYGIDEDMMAAYMLDPDRALPLIEKQAKAVEFGTAAARQGLKVTTIGEQYATRAPETGYTAEQGYSAIAGILPQAQNLAQVYGQEYTQAEAEQEVFGGLESAKRKRQKLGQMEQDTFGGRSGVAAGSLAASKTGQF